MDAASSHWVGLHERDNFNKHIASFLEQENVEKNLRDKFKRMFRGFRGRMNIEQVSRLFTSALLANKHFYSHLVDIEFPVNEREKYEEKCAELCRVIIADAVNRGLDAPFP